ncbi:MAG TPA: regulatory protein RecX [Longimicrobiaceae bacterium]
MKIVAIEKVAGARERVRLRLDSGEAVELAAEVVYRAGFRDGEEVASCVLEEALLQDLAWRAREAGLRLLAHRPRTVSELRLRLARKGFPPEVVERCLEELAGKGLLDDGAFAEMFARDRVRLQPRGRRRVLGELRAKGVQAETADAALDQVFAEEEVDELSLARQAARRWRRRSGEDPRRARQRFMAFLARRGFPSEVARRVAEEVLGSEEAADW